MPTFEQLTERLDIDVYTAAKQIGGSKDEVELLLQDSIFKAKDIQNHAYSKAWKPRMVVGKNTPIILPPVEA